MAAEMNVVLPLREFIHIQKHFFGRFQIAFPPGMNRVFLALLVTRVIPIAVGKGWDICLVSLDIPDEFSIQDILQCRSMRKRGLRIGFFRLEISNNLRFFARIVSQPVIVICARLSMYRDIVGDDFCDWRCHFFIAYSSIVCSMGSCGQ